MELVIVIILGTAVLFVAMIAGAAKTADAQSDKARDAGEATYQKIFTGRNVVYNAGVGALTVHEVARAAERYGYDVVSVSAPSSYGQQTMTMVRRDDAPAAPSPPPTRATDPDDDNSASKSWWWRPAR